MIYNKSPLETIEELSSYMGWHAKMMEGQPEFNSSLDGATTWRIKLTKKPKFTLRPSLMVKN